MTVYTWPTGDSAFSLKAMNWGALHNSRTNTSELNGASQGISLPGTRRTLTLEVPEQTYAERARLAAFFERLDGPENRLQIWDVSRPTPPGLGGSPTVSGAVAQFAESLNIASGGLAGVNLLTKSQAFDAAAWTKTSATVTANATTAPDGSTTADKLVEPVSGATSHFVTQAVSGFAAGQRAVFSVHLKAAERTWATARILAGGALASVGLLYINLATGTIGTTVGLADTPAVASLGGGWYRVSVPVMTTGSGSLTCALFTAVADANNSSVGDGVSGIYPWGAQLEIGAVATDYYGPPTLTAGDWLSLVTSTGNQLVRVMNTVVADTSDLLTGVEIRHALRGTVASGSAVTIAQPTGLYVQRNPDQVLMSRGGRFMCPATSIDLVEVFA